MSQRLLFFIHVGLSIKGCSFSRVGTLHIRINSVQSTVLILSTLHHIPIPMHPTFFLAGLAAVLPAVLAEELGADDVPSACTAICQPIVDLTNTCDIDPKETDNDNDKRRKLRLRGSDEFDEEAIEANCICTNTSFDVAAVMALCASCMSQNSRSTEGMNS